MNLADELLRGAPRPEGFEALRVIDAVTGQVLAASADPATPAGGDPDGDPPAVDGGERLARAASEAVRRFSAAAAVAPGGDEVDDVVVTLSGRHHLIRRIPDRAGTDLLLLLTLDRRRANLAQALHLLRRAGAGLDAWVRVGRAAPTDPVESALRRAARAGRSGTLYVPGASGGAIHLEAGRVVHAECVLTPPAELLVLHRVLPHEAWLGVLAGLGGASGRAAAVSRGRAAVAAGAMPALELDLLRRTTLADALGALLVGPGAEAVRPRFVRGGLPAIDAPGEPPTVSAVLTEVERRRTELRGLAGGRVDLRSVPARTPRLPVPVLRLPTRDWNLVCCADGLRTVLEIAWLLGRGVHATTLEVARLVAAGLLVAPAPAAAGGPVQVSLASR